MEIELGPRNNNFDNRVLSETSRPTIQTNNKGLLSVVGILARRSLSALALRLDLELIPKEFPPFPQT